MANNLARVLPETLSARVDRRTWTPQPVFDLVRTVGDVTRDDLEATLNLGVGMVAVVEADEADAAVRQLQARDVPAWICGEVVDAPGGRVEMVGQHG